MELQEIESEKIYKWKFVEGVKIPGQIVQIDTKYIKIKDKTVYQFTAIDLQLDMCGESFMKKRFLKILLSF